MRISKDNYISIIQDNLDNLTEDVAHTLFTLGSGQEFIDDNDIFDALHGYLGSISVPTPDAERLDAVNEIRGLIVAYLKERTI